MIFFFITAGALVFSCKQIVSTPSTPSDSSANPDSGLNPQGAVPAPTTPPAGYNQSVVCDRSNQEGGDWGGITCTGSSNRDQNFREFLSSGSLIIGAQDNLGTLGEIDCQPSNSGGILFRMTALVNGEFNPTGGNPNLRVQATGTILNFHIAHKPVNPGQESAFTGPITFELQGVNGSVNGSRATITFEDDKGSVTFDGSFDMSWYEGTVQYNNKVKKCHHSDSHCREHDAYRGTLGQFRIPTCKVFFSLD